MRRRLFGGVLHQNYPLVGHQGSNDMPANIQIDIIKVNFPIAINL